MTNREEDTKIKVMSFDDKLLEYPEEVFRNSTTIFNMLDMAGELIHDSSPIPLCDKSCTEKNLKYIFEYYSNKNREAIVINYEEIDENLINIINAANYLDCKEILDRLCVFIADEIKKCNSPEDIQKKFNIKNEE